MPKPARVRTTNLLALLCLPALAPALAPWLAPWHWLADLLACFCAQALVCLLPAALVLAAARRFRLAGLMGAGALSALGAILVAFAAERPAGSTEPAPGSGNRLRVFAANLLYGNEGNAGAFLAAVRARDPDVLFLCEATPTWLTAIDAPLSDYPFRCERAGQGPFGVAMWSRLPLRDTEIVPLGFDWAPAILATVQTQAGPTGVLGVHPPRPGGPRHNAERDRALAALPDLLARLPAPRIVLGDCNATPFNPSLRRVLAAAGMRLAGGAGWFPTWPQQVPWPLRVPIDHVLLDATVRATTFDTGPAFGSDHAPVFAELTW